MIRNRWARKYFKPTRKKLKETEIFFLSENPKQKLFKPEIGWSLNYEVPVANPNCKIDDRRIQG